MATEDDVHIKMLEGVADLFSTKISDAQFQRLIFHDIKNQICASYEDTMIGDHFAWEGENHGL